MIELITDGHLLTGQLSSHISRALRYEHTATLRQIKVLIDGQSIITVRGPK